MRRRRRWWIWVCTDCGGLRAPIDLRTRCYTCGRPASATESWNDEETLEAFFWACHECGGDGSDPPHELTACVRCGRTEMQLEIQVVLFEDSEEQEPDDYEYDDEPSS
jgi:hypothetical protein